MTEDKETKHGGHKNGRKGGLSGSSFFTWFMVIALLGVWTSVAVVWFELVDYEEVLGKLGVYDADGDGDFDVDDAKVLLGLTKDGSNENIDSLEEVLNILAEESSDWFYGFLSFLYDIMTPFEMLEEEEEESEATDGVDEGPGGVAKRKTKAKEPSKEELKKEKEKLMSRKENKSEERKKGKTDKENDRKDKKIADSDISWKESSRGKKDREKEKLDLDRSAKSKDNRKKSANMKDKDDRKEGRSSARHAHLEKGNSHKRARA